MPFETEYATQLRDQGYRTGWKDGYDEGYKAAWKEMEEQKAAEEEDLTKVSVVDQELTNISLQYYHEGLTKISIDKDQRVRAVLEAATKAIEGDAKKSDETNEYIPYR